MAGAADGGLFCLVTTARSAQRAGDFHGEWGWETNLTRREPGHAVHCRPARPFRGTVLVG